MEWGTVGEWVGGLATAAGLWFAARELREGRRERERSEKRRHQAELKQREAMARSVSAWNDRFDEPSDDQILEAYPATDLDELPESAIWFHLRLNVHNGGDYPIEDVVLEVGELPFPPAGDEPLPRPMIVVGTVPSGSTVVEEKISYFSHEPAFSELPHLVELTFRDAWGTWWTRSMGEVSIRTTPPRLC